MRIDESWEETALRRARVAETILERWSASPHLGPRIRRAAVEVLENQRRVVLMRMRRVIGLRAVDRTLQFAATCLIDAPSPFAPIDELRRFLKTAEAMPQDDAGVQDAIAHVRDALAWREREDRLCAGGKS